MSSAILKTHHFLIWLLRKRGDNYYKIHQEIVDMAEDNYTWRGKLYSLKSTHSIAVPGKLGVQLELLMFDADNCEPLILFDPHNDKVEHLLKHFTRSSGMVGQSTSEQALRNSEAVDTIQRQQKMIMILGVGLAISIFAVIFFGMYSFGLFKVAGTTTPTSGGTTGPRAILQIIRGLLL